MILGSEDGAKEEGKPENGAGMCQCCVNEVALKTHPVEDSGSSLQDYRVRDSRGSTGHSEWDGKISKSLVRGAGL